MCLFRWIKSNNLNILITMSGSLPKKRIAQKQNSHRLSNSKINSVYNPSLTKLNCIQFQLPQDRLKCTTKRPKIPKTTRKHQLSVEYILQNKVKQPYSMRSVQLDKGDKSKDAKTKRKKKEHISNEESRFIVPVFDFSRSNSLIVFSEKDSTINGNLHHERFFFSKSMTQTQAAVLIQKTWRGYLTRKLLQQYINEEQNKITTAMNNLKSRQDSFVVEERAEEMNFSEFSSIQDDTVAIGNKAEVDWSYGKQVGAFTTEMTSSRKQKNKQSPNIPKSFFKNHRTEPDLQESKCSNLLSHSLKKSNKLNLHSQTTAFSYFKPPDKRLDTPLDQIVGSLREHMTQKWMSAKSALRQKLALNEFDIGQLAIRSNRLKEIFEGTEQFLGNVMFELNAIIQDMKSIIENGVEDEVNTNEQKHYPKSQLFTIQLEDNQPELPSYKEHFSQGQLKLQSYLNDLVLDYQSNFIQSSEIEYLCQVLKANSELGIKTIAQRCLLQFTVEIITSNYQLQDLSRIVQQQTFGQGDLQGFIVKWINQLNKWEMGPIQEVTQAMESSSFMNGEVSKSIIYQ